MEDSTFATTYKYRPLESERHIRLLQILEVDDDATPRNPVYKIVHKELLSDGVSLEFEAVSYTWGDSKRVANLRFEDESGTIGLTENLNQALPFLCNHSTTKHLWIDQICINQVDQIERAHQVSVMHRIYKYATRVLIWLGPEDENIRICKRWCRALNDMLREHEISDKLIPDSPQYDSNMRYLVVRSSFTPVADNEPIFAPAIRGFWRRVWFTRGWIVQEFLLANESYFLAGDTQFSLLDLSDMTSVPDLEELGTKDQSWFSYNILMNLKLSPFTDPQPLRFLRIMYQAASEFAVSELGDRLYANLGLIEDNQFAPDYALSVKANFTRFAVFLAQSYGSLDFLSLWTANLDELLPNTPPELKGFPSWVPSWSCIPLSAPYRFATGCTRSVRLDIFWNAALGRKHIHDQVPDAAETGRLHVRGQIVDRVETISNTKFLRYYDADSEYLDGLVAQLKNDLLGLDHWTQIEMIDFLNVAASNGGKPAETAREILGHEVSPLMKEIKGWSSSNTGLAGCLTAGRGRKFVRTQKGRLGLAPYIGTKAMSENEGVEGSAIVVLHGCSVPLVLQRIGEENEYSLVGDCYIGEIMKGEAVFWEEGNAETFILV